jgi:hypothetical protein
VGLRAVALPYPLKTSLKKGQSFGGIPCTIRAGFKVQSSVTSFLYGGVRGYWTRRVGGGGGLEGVVGWHLCSSADDWGCGQDIRWWWNGWTYLVVDGWWWQCERIGGANQRGLGWRRDVYD